MERADRVNLTGAFLVTREVVAQMLTQGKGAIINIASISAFVARGGGAAYAPLEARGADQARDLRLQRQAHPCQRDLPRGRPHRRDQYLLSPERRRPHIAAAPTGRRGKRAEIAELAAPPGQ